MLSTQRTTPDGGETRGSPWPWSGTRRSSSSTSRPTASTPRAPSRSAGWFASCPAALGLGETSLSDGAILTAAIPEDPAAGAVIAAAIVIVLFIVESDEARKYVSIRFGLLARSFGDGIAAGGA